MTKPRLDQGPDYERGFIDGMQHQMQSSVDKAINRMAQPEQEPVAWQLKPHQPPEEGEFIEITARWGKRFVEVPNPIIGGNNLVRFYFDPPQRTWVGLTDEEKNAMTWGNDIYRILELAEAKLKEKNT